MNKSVRIGGGGGFWGDSLEGPVQLVEGGKIDYLTMDYLAEITMSILARMKSKNPDLGYASDFVSLMSGTLAQQIADKKIKVVTNAGGVNPMACKAALETSFAKIGIALSIAVVEGDDLMDRVDEDRRTGKTEMFTGDAMPAKFLSANAYLGAFPIARALDEGADIVLTGRCVDSALALGALIHEFGWTVANYDELAGGSLAGHVIECGTQATGGLFTDYDLVDGWDDMGFPIAICHPDGSFELTKPADTGGLVTPQTIAEQIVYEVGDPAAYILPDVVCDFSQVRVEQSGPQTVRVSNAKGHAPTPTCKVSATFADGYRSVVTMMIVGRHAAAKAQKVGDAILKRVARLMAKEGHTPLSETLVEILGAEHLYGPHTRARNTREVTLRIAVRHTDKNALNIFAREIYPAATSMAQGLTGFSAGRPAPQPVIRLFSYLCDKSDLKQQVRFNDKIIALSAEQPKFNVPSGQPKANIAETHPIGGSTACVPLLAIAHGRSGDKGDSANIGILARDPMYLPAIHSGVTETSVAAWLDHLVNGTVTRFAWPGLNGINLLMTQALGGGGVASLRNDPQGKSFAQILLDMPVEVPALWCENGGPLETWSTPKE